MSKSINVRKRGPATLAIHGRERRRKAYHAVSTPIVQTSNFSFGSMAEVVDRVLQAVRLALDPASVSAQR